MQCKLELIVFCVFPDEPAEQMWHTANCKIKGGKKVACTTKNKCTQDEWEFQFIEDWKLKCTPAK